MEFIKKYKIYIFEIFLLIVLSLIPLLWFKPGHVILGLDSGYAIDHIKFFQYRMNTWMPNPNFGVDMSAEMGLLPLVALPAIISFFGASPFDVQKILLVGWFFILAISIYIFLRELFPKRDQGIIRLVGTFIYLFNFHLYSFWLQGEQPMLASYVILPLFILILYRFATGKTRILKAAVLAGLVYLLFNSGGIRGIPLIGPVILSGLSVFIYFGIINWKKEKFSYILRFIFLFLLFAAISLPFNAYWIFPFIASFNHEFSTQVTIAGGISGAISWAKFISSHDSFLNLFRLQGDNNWYHFSFLWSNNYLTNPLLIISSFVFASIAFAAPIFAKARHDLKIILLFAALALVSFFFAAGAHPPFGWIYVYMLEHIPGFATFRSPYYKFMPTVYFSFAVLIGFTIFSLIQKMKKNIGIVFGIAFLVFILIYNYPYFQNTNADFNKPFTNQLKVPNYVLEFGRMINNSDISGKTLVVPQTNTKITIKEYIWGYYGAFSLFALMTDKPFVQYDAYLFNDSANALINVMYSKLRSGDYVGFSRIVGVSGIRYILLTKDVAYNYKIAPQENPLYYEKILSDKRYFKKIWNRGEWVMYEILGVDIQPEISALSGVSLVSPDATALNDYFEESGNSFVLFDQIDSLLLSKINIKEKLIDYTCISCSLLNSQTLPVVSYPNVTPGSILYKFKMMLDENSFSKVSDPNKKLDFALGLSLKRVSELGSFLIQPFNSKVNNQWISAADAMLKYWIYIDTHLNDNLSYPDYALYLKIKGYGDVEKDELTKVVVGQEINKSLELKNSIFNVISQIDKTLSKLNVTLSEKDWNNNFLYKIESGRNLQDLTTHLGSKVLPEVNTPKIVRVAKSTLYHVNSDISLINVELPDLPNLLTEKKTVSVIFPASKKPCVIYNVSDFRWDKKYLLTVASLDETAPKTIYVKMTRGYFKTQDSLAPDTNFFTPDFTFSPNNKEGTFSSFEFTGQQNDESAKVYLCTESPFDPSLTFNNIFLREKITPPLYYFTKTEREQLKPPILHYKKVSATKYVIDVKDVKFPFILSFLQTSSPNWKIYINGQEQKDKFMINGFANAWYIQKGGTYTATLEFYPQQAFYKGIAVTLVSLGIALLYLVWLKRKQNEN